MSETNRTQLAYVMESTWGTTPSSPAYKVLRITSMPDLGFNPVTKISNELRSDRNIPDLILVDADAGGSFGFELSFDSMPDIYKMALFNSWTVQVSDSTATEVVELTKTITVAADGNTNFPQYSMVWAEGFTAAANNGVKTVASSTATTVVVDQTMADETSTSGTLWYIGVQGPTGDITATTTGTLSGGNALESTLVDFTKLLPNVVPGDWIYIGSGGGNYGFAAGNGFARVGGTITANEIPLAVVPVGFTNDTATTKTIRIVIGDSLANGTTRYSCSLEQSFLDHTSPAYGVYPGSVVSSLQLTLNAADIAMGTVNFMTKTPTYSTTRASGASTTAAPTYGVLNTSSNVASIIEGTSALSTNYALNATLTIDNGLRKRNAIGTLGAHDIRAGRCNVTGTLNTSFEDTTLLAKLIGNTTTGFMTVLRDSIGQCFLIDIPSMKYTSGNPSVGGVDQDVDLSLGLQGIYNATYGYTVKIMQFHYLP